MKHTAQQSSTEELFGLTEEEQYYLDYLHARRARRSRDAQAPFAQEVM